MVEPGSTAGAAPTSRTGSTGDSARRRDSWIGAVLGLVAALLALAVAAVGVVVFFGHSDQGSGARGVVNLALGGRPEAPTAVDQDFVVRELGWDRWLIAGYGLATVTGALLLLWIARSSAARRWGWFGLSASIVAVVADLLENHYLRLAVQGADPVLRWADPYDVASAMAVIKFSALLPALVLAGAGIGLTLARSTSYLGRLLFRWMLRRPGGHVLTPGADARAARPVLPDDPWVAIPEDTGTEAPAQEEAESPDQGRAPELLDRWARASDIPHCAVEPAPTAAMSGICLSGGGIRAASVAMGALQSAPWRDRVIPDATYLVSVSGGGYTAGAFQQALTEAGDPALTPDENLLSGRPGTAFLPGTVEEDHLRRHSSYLASSPKELLVALGLLGRHLLLTLTLLFGPAILLGVAAGEFYDSVRLTAIPESVVQATTDDAVSPAFPSPRPGALWALGLVVALAVLLWLVAQYASAWKVRPVRSAAGAASVMVAGLAGVVLVLAVVLPTVMWAASWALYQSGGALTIGGPIGGVLLTYVASVASVAWRNRKLVGGRKKDDQGSPPRTKAAPRGVVQLLLVVAALLVLAVGWLLVLGGMALVGLGVLTPPTQITLVALLLVVLFLGGFSDETTLSLHPFYRTRLATAFAVRRVRSSTSGQVVARPYQADERTALSEYGLLPGETPFPHVVFAASATLGEKRTAPGSHRTSYTFCGHWVGGPDVGYVSAEALQKLAPPRMQRDLTVQGAVALSGAAIAASIGGQRTAWYETLFVVTGLRLGAWMPNPAYLIRTHTRTRPWTEPGLPRNRRLTYLLRQLFGVHSSSAPLLQVTDGGFYDNLGLVELLRRGCTRIYCIDASGDNPPAATTLSQALTVAYHELGVVTELEGGTWSTFTAGSAEPLTPKDPLAALSARLSQSGVITGTFEYPEGSPHARRGTGVLVVAKSSLWPGLPYEVLAHAQGADPFPRDSTGDQFFDDRQYAAYTALGRALGKASVAAMDEYDETGKRRATPRFPAGGSGANGGPLPTVPAQASL